MLDRRDFLRTGAAATAVALSGARLAHAATGPTVAIIRDKTKTVVQKRTIDAAIAQKLVDQALMTIAGKDDVAKAWGTFVTPKDKVAVKFNGLFKNAATHPEVVIAICKGMIAAGVKPENILLYDRDQRAFTTAGLKGDIPQNPDGGIKRDRLRQGDFHLWCVEKESLNEDFPAIGRPKVVDLNRSGCWTHMSSG